jgi:hypothetical protein
MKQDRPNWLEILYGPYVKLAGFLYRTYHANRERLRRLKGRKGVSRLLNAVMVLTLVVWLAIWATASEEGRNRLTVELKQKIQGVFPAAGE